MDCFGQMWWYIGKGPAFIQKECFTDMFKNSTLFYFVIITWIFLVVVNIILYGVLLLKIVTLRDYETQEIYKNIFMQIICGLFTFSALANLPVRLQRFHYSYTERRSVVSIAGKTEAVVEEEWIYILLTWNCIFQLINQGTRCLYYDWKSASKYPGVIWVNVFFALSILMAVAASILQAIAEERLKQLNKIETVTNCLKFFCDKLKKVESKTFLGFAEESDDRVSIPAGCVKHIGDVKERQVSHPSVSVLVDPVVTGIDTSVIYPDVSVEIESPVTPGSSIQMSRTAFEI